jgi:hypothetical protein
MSKREPFLTYEMWRRLPGNEHKTTHEFVVSENQKQQIEPKPVASDKAEGNDSGTF